MPYHIDEENSELAFEVREGNKLVIKIKSNIFSDSLELYLIKVGDNTEPTDKNVFSSLRVLKEIENLHDTILKEINSVTSGFWELKQDSQGNEYISTKYNVLTEGGLTTYGLGEQKLGTIYDGLPIDNDTIYWEEVEGSRVLKAKGSGGGSTVLDETKLWNVLGTPGDQQIDYSHLRSAFSQFSNEFVTINTEQEITALKHFTAGLSVGESKKKIYEENGVVYIDADVAVTGAMTFYATAGRTVSTIMDAVTVDGITIKKENNVLKAVSGTGSSFDENAMWSALSGSTTEQINKSHLTTALTGYATESWVTSKNYAVKATTLAGYGITDAYTKTESDNKYPAKTGSGASGTWGINVTGNAGSATKLQTARTLWGQSFNGTKNVSGDINNVGNINFTLNGRLVSNGSLELSYKNDDTTSLTFTGTVFRPFTSAHNNIDLGASTARWRDLYIGRNAYVDGITKTEDFYIGGIRLHKTADGVITLDGNLAVTGGITTYAIDPVSASTIMDGVVVDGVTIKKENGKLVAVGGGEAGSVAWGNITGKPSVFPTNIANITDLHSSWDSVLASQKPAWLTAVSIATISDLHANWDALLKAAPSAYVTRWPTISEVTGKQNLIVKLNGGTTEGTNQFTYNATGAKTINITPAGIGAAASSHNHSWSNITSGKPTTLAGYGITDAPTKTGSGASGTWGIGITGNAGSASKLQAEITLWGQSFNGTKPISGIIDSCTRVRNSSNNPLYLGNSDNTSYVFTQDIVSHDGLDKWVILSRGVAWFKNVNIGYIYENSGSHELNVNGVISAKSYSGNGIRIECDNDGNNSESRANEINSYTGGVNIQYDTSGNVSLCVGGGNVGVGVEIPSAKLHVSGNILATGGCTFYGSDIRYKSIMQEVNLSLLDIAKAPSFVYHWNKEGMKCDRLNLGGSAQYTQSVLPWAVEENDNFLSMDYATVAYTFAVHTARHLLTYETRTDKKIKKLEREIVILKKQLKKLGYEEVRTLDDSGI